MGGDPLGTMKKLLLTFSLISVFTFANEYNLDFFINKRRSNSLQKEINIIENKKLERKEDYLQKGKYNQLEITADGFYTRDYFYEGEKEQGSLRLDYGIFNYNLDYDWSNKEVTRETIGIKKSLNDFIYSPEAFNRNTFDYEKKISVNNLIIEENQDIVRIIEKYGLIKKLEKAYNLKVKIYENSLEDLEQIKIKLEFGQVSEIDSELAKLRNEKVKEELKAIEDNIKNAKRELLILVDMDTSIVFNLLEFDKLTSVNFEEVYMKEYKNEEYKLELSKENYDYTNSQDLPKIDLLGDYDLDKKGYRVGLRFYKGIKFIDLEEENAEFNYEIAKLNFKEAKKLRDDKVKSLQIQYETLQNRYKILEKEGKYKEKEILIYKKRFEEGLIDYVDYTDRLNELEEVLIELYKTEQDINVFKHKIDYL